MVSHLDFSPPFSGTHTTFFQRREDSQFHQGLWRHKGFPVVSEEAMGSGCQEIRKQIYVIDSTEETNPIPWPRLRFRTETSASGRPLRSHQFAETKDGEIIGGTLLYVAYFNAGLRVVDISDPFKPKEVGYFIPR